jgi:hypothetical protein
MRPVFSSDERIGLNACVQWALRYNRGMAGYINGYAEAAVAVINAARDRVASPDLLVFPLVFLWRHHIELALKNVIMLGRCLAGEDSRNPSGHNLAVLWREASGHIHGLDDEEPPEFTHVDAIIQQIQRVDERADGFRYPTQIGSSKQNLQAVPELVNLSVLHDAMCAVANFLACATTEMEQRLDYRAEMEAEMARYYSGS